jgi:hypothetical protein
MNIKKYLLIAGIFIFSFIISNYSINNIFIANSPKLNPFYLTNLKIKLNYFIALVKNPAFMLTKIFNQQTYDFAAQPGALSNELFKPVSKGVSAYEKGDGTTIYRIQPGTKITIKDITLPDGRVIKGIILGN